MDWKNQLTKTPYLVFFVILISVGLTSAYAINITLGGTVDITEILNMMGNRIINVGSPTDGTDAATKEYVDQASSANILLPISDESSIIKCPRDMSQAGQWCIDKTVRGPSIFDDAQNDCLDEGKALTSVEVLFACDLLNLSTSDCGAKTDNSDAQLWTSDYAYETTLADKTIFDRVITLNGSNDFNEVDTTVGSPTHEYFCSQQTLQYALHQHSTLRGDPVIVAVGDIACEKNSEHRDKSDWCHELQTSDLALAVNPDAVFLLGDIQYPNGELDDFLGSYDPTWGRMKSITYPSAGNHDYDSFDGAKGYFEYFGAAAGEPTMGWYSFDIGSWHIISLNSNCKVWDSTDQKYKNVACTDPPGTADQELECPDSSTVKMGKLCPDGQSHTKTCLTGIEVHEDATCTTGEQTTWLVNDLAENDSKCTIAFWHHPLFSSGGNKSFPNVKPFWDALYAANADVVLTGHAHDYERFFPQDPDNQLDETNGITQFVVGTGGWSLWDAKNDNPNNSAVFNAKTYGVLKLVLHESSYDWEFIGEPGSTFTDQGTGLCN